MVDVNATMETCVAADVLSAGFALGGYKVPIIVPRFVMNASPGPTMVVSNDPISR